MKAQYALLIVLTFAIVSCSDEKSSQMVYVEGGTFYMGSTNPDRDQDESKRLVTVDDFYIGKYEVTQAEWVKEMRINPSCFKNDSYPVECVSWDDVMRYIDRLNKRTGRHFRLPTQAEWEYAAKGGKHASSEDVSNDSQLVENGWFLKNSEGTTHSVGLMKPNGLGLHDMTGNVHEWCDGLYDSAFYAQDSLMKHEYNFKNVRVFRGGSWASDSKHCRVSNINYNSRETRNFTIGFRLAENVSK